MDRSHRQAQCEGKEAFESWTRASKILKRRNRSRDERQTIYKCRYCHKFHLGTKQYVT